MDHDDRTLNEPTLVPPTGSTPRERMEAVLYELRRVVVGQDRLLDRVLVALLSRGHVLLEGVPGLAKTLTLETVARVCGGHFSRIQFTPDLVPSDVVGGQVLDRHGDFSTRLGPVFCNFLLADEINRAPAKVQSALLEVMQEHQVTIGGETHLVPDPFLVLATENPIESEGTYPLPEAQLDRFLLKVVVDYPAFGEEVTVVERSLGSAPALEPVLSIEQLRELQAETREVYVDPVVQRYAVSLAAATRDLSQYQHPELAPYVAFGASPRGPIALVHAARALALIRGRAHVLPQDVQEVSKDALRHRLVLTYAALAEGVTADHVLEAVLASVPVPQIDLARTTEVA